MAQSPAASGAVRTFCRLVRTNHPEWCWLIAKPRDRHLGKGNSVKMIGAACALVGMLAWLGGAVWITDKQTATLVVILGAALVATGIALSELQKRNRSAKRYRARSRYLERGESVDKRRYFDRDHG